MVSIGEAITSKDNSAPQPVYPFRKSHVPDSFPTLTNDKTKMREPRNLVLAQSTGIFAFAILAGTIADKFLVPDTQLTILTAAYRPDLELLTLAGESLAQATSGSAEWLIALDSETDTNQINEVMQAAEKATAGGPISVRVQGQPFRGGAGTTRTVALSNVRTRWVTVLDCDDLFPAGSLDIQLEMLAQHPEAMWSVGSGETLHADGTVRLWESGLPEILQAGDIARHTRDKGSMPTMPISGIWDTDSVRALPLRQDVGEIG